MVVVEPEPDLGGYLSPVEAHEPFFGASEQTLRPKFDLNAEDLTNRNKGAINDRAPQVVVITDLVQAATIAVKGRRHSRSTLECARDLGKSIGLGARRSDASLSKPVVGRKRLNRLSTEY